jgi:heme A synthase
MPFGSGRLVDIQLTHRLLMYLTTFALVAMVGVALRQGVRDRAFLIAPVLLAFQILLGAMNVWLGEHPGLIVAHLTLATVLWATVVYAATSLLAVPSGARGQVEGPEPRQGDTQPVAA